MKARCLLISLSLLALVGCTRGSDVLWLANGEFSPEGTPACQYRILDHWDNLDDSVERGYAGLSIWEWTSDSIPVERIRTYGRLNKAIGINGSVLNNVNSNPAILDEEHLQRVARIADILREYGIRTYLSVNFATPLSLGELQTADPLNEDVINWWNSKVDAIYSLIPDFGGFLVKASSEGQPGPQDFGRSHVDGANMLADALAKHGGILMWRAFVYAANSPDRAKQAYEEFVPLDGQFRENVIIQIKNGPVDFQPREPVSPLFWGLHSTESMAELQITQEYTGQENHLCFLPPMWKECLDAIGPRKAIAGVANTGQDDNWCGQMFAQANWYAFGRLAWNPSLSSDEIADEWIHHSFKKPWWCTKKRFERYFVEPVKAMMLESHEAVVNYMMPLGLHHLFYWEHHYGPQPWCDIPGAREDWMPRYYHRADSTGIGFDRSESGSNAVSQYPDSLSAIYGSVADCPENLILWFHHIPWDYTMKSGRSLWDQLCIQYDLGVKQVSGFLNTWENVKPYLDSTVWEETYEKLKIQEKDARLWRDACIQYFQTFSEKEIPADIIRPEIPLDTILSTPIYR